MARPYTLPEKAAPQCRRHVQIRSGAGDGVEIEQHRLEHGGVAGFDTMKLERALFLLWVDSVKKWEC